jgi:putative ABC transport system permease protein
MQFIDIAKLSTRMFKTNPARTWLTILGMGVGTGAVVMLVGLGFGLQGIILEQIVFGETLLSLNVSAPSSGVVVLDRRALDDFLQVENVRDVAPMASFQALITYEGLTGNVFIQGVGPSYLRYTGTIPDTGDVFREDDADDANRVLLSQSVLRLFGIEDAEEIIGKQVGFRLIVPSASAVGGVQEVQVDKRYFVKGVTNDATSLSAMILMSELERYVAITGYERAQVRVARSEFLNEVQDVILERGYSVSALSKTVEQATKIFQGIQIVLASFGGIALIVSAIGMFNTMTVTLLERTNEIGIMRTIGASPLDIKILFVSEAVVVGFLGGIVGIAIGASIGLIFNFSLNAVASHFGGVAVSLFRFPFWFLFFISTFSGVVGFMTGIFPARRAAALNPLDAIRYK